VMRENGIIIGGLTVSYRESVKCFHCSEREHIAAKYIKEKNAIRDSCAVSERCDEADNETLG